MFLPEDLLFKSGQLARVWLAANQHKKLTKAQVLQDKIDEDIQVIIRPEGAAGGPLALRLNGQLLLGVVRIYHRKAHYLHDDCNDALWKIKMVGCILPQHQQS
jgi:cohesin complex subunit SCC1